MLVLGPGWEWKDVKFIITKEDTYINLHNKL